MKKIKLNIQLFSIPHTYIEFEDFPSTNTPLTAANLNQMQSDIYDDIRENGGAQIVDSYSTSTTDGYSANYVNGLNTYSTTEHRIGTWINGKPLYRKVIDVGNLPNTNDKKIDTGLIFNSNNCILRNFYGVASYSNGISFPLPYINPIDITYTVSLNLDSNNQVVVTTGSDRSLMAGYVVLEYTKTTD